MVCPQEDWQVTAHRISLTARDLKPLGLENLAGQYERASDYDALAAKVEEAQNAAVTLSLKLGAAQSALRWIALSNSRLTSYDELRDKASSVLEMPGVKCNACESTEIDRNGYVKHKDWCQCFASNMTGE